jgi:purine-binding chemotaxis protein CheW
MHANAGLNQLVVFSLEGGRYGLALSAVERVVRAVDITALPKAPDIVSGVINLQGRIIPVVDVRKRFRLPERPLDLRDQLIVAHTSRRAVALVVDAVAGIVECPERDVIAAEGIFPDIGHVEGIVKTKDGMVLIHDLDQFLTLEEEQCLGEAMSNA